MTPFLKRPLLFTLVLILTVTGAALRVGQATSTSSATKPEGNESVQQSEPESDGTQDERQEPKLKSFAPYDIQFFIEENPNANLKDLWRQLNIYPDFGDGEDPSITERFLETCYGCKAEMFEYDLDDKPGKEILLRIEDRLAESCRYLIFKRVHSRSSEDKWKLLGHVDWGSGKYRMPQHSVVVSGGKTWLLVEVQDGSGSGYAHYSYRLFKVESSRVKELLSFPSEGYLSSCLPFPVQEFSSRIVNCNESEVITTVEVEFSTAYYDDLDTSKTSELLWAKNQKEVYTGDTARGRLRLDASKSDMSEQEMDDIYESDPLSSENFLKYNFPQLTKIATGKNTRRKEWLRRYLNKCRDMPENNALQQMLQQ